MDALIDRKFSKWESWDIVLRTRHWMLSIGRSSTWNATLGQFFIKLSYTTFGIASSPSKFQLLPGKLEFQGAEVDLPDGI
jgi:hypothetical protein